jgi:hypothetical protein
MHAAAPDVSRVMFLPRLWCTVRVLHAAMARSQWLSMCESRMTTWGMTKMQQASASALHLCASLRAVACASYFCRILVSRHVICFSPVTVYSLVQLL